MIIEIITRTEHNAPLCIDSATMTHQATGSTSVVPVLDAALIERLFGQAKAEYVCNKHTGGVSGKKGTRYEDLFATFTIASILADHVSQGGDLPVIEEQALGFVDDLAVAHAKWTKYTQCKNSESVSWHSGTHPISTDFKCQLDLAAALQKPNPAVELVVANQSTAAKLAGEIPPDIAASTTVTHFPYLGGFNRLVMEYEPVRDKLAALTRTEDPTLDELGSAFGALMIAWIGVTGVCSIEGIMQAARQQSPQLLRSYPWTSGEQFLRPELNAALAGVSDLLYTVKRGFFSWACEGCSGTLTCECDSEEFSRFQQRVIQAKPKHFDDFWSLLP
ncbi:hypothetical protein [Ralstonia solanacearum]|uniref:hypothetical protein n=1 Tax=Ralstonia solanacearum TaxID=305 RepID=UPI0013017559|nr:hypothetical protein [Ralstonia solanacearum]